MALRHAAVARHVLWLTLRRERPRIGAPHCGVTPAAPESLSARWQSTATAPSSEEQTFRDRRHLGPAQQSAPGATKPGDNLLLFMNGLGHGLFLPPVGDGRSERVAHRDRSAQPRHVSSAPAHSTASNTAPLIEDLLSLPPEHAAPLIPAFLSSVQPHTVGAINKDVRRLRKLIKHMSPSRQWAGLDDGVRRALLSLWARWLGLVVQLRDVGGLPRMGGREGAEFAPGRFTPLFLALLSSPSPPSRPARQGTHATDTLPALSAALALMASVDAQPTDFQLELIVRHLMPNASVRDILDAEWLACARDDPGVAAVRLLEFIHPESASSAGPADNPPPMDSLVTTPSLPIQERQWPTARAGLLLACGDVALAHLEGDRHGDTASDKWWSATADMVRDWTSLVAGYQARYLAALRGAASAAVVPTAVEAHALHLLARYTLVRARPRDMRSTSFDVGGTDVGDPLVCLSLLLGAAGDGGGPSAPRSAQVDKRVVSVVVRWAHHAASRRLLWPIVGLLDLLTAQANPALGSASYGQGRPLPPPPMPLRTALFLAGAAREPEDLLRILHSLETLAVEPDARHAALMATESEAPRPTATPLSEPQRAHRRQRRSARRVPLRVLALAREADARGLQLPNSPASFEARVHAMFESWGLPHLVEENEREQRVHAAPGAQGHV